MKKFAAATLTAVVLLTGASLFGGHHHAPGPMPGPRPMPPPVPHHHGWAPMPPPVPYYHHYHDRGSGVRLATDIVNLVGASANLVAPAPAVVVQQPAPVVVQQPVVQPVVVQQPVVQPAPVVIQAAPAPVQPQVIVL